MTDLRNRVALVTGGSRGISKAIWVSLAEAGAAVEVNYRERGEEAETVSDLICSHKGRAAACRADVSLSSIRCRRSAKSDAFWNLDRGSFLSDATMMKCSAACRVCGVTHEPVCPPPAVIAPALEARLLPFWPPEGSVPHRNRR